MLILFDSYYSILNAFYGYIRREMETLLQKNVIEESFAEIE